MAMGLAPGRAGVVGMVAKAEERCPAVAPDGVIDVFDAGNRYLRQQMSRHAVILGGTRKATPAIVLNTERTLKRSLMQTTVAVSRLVLLALLIALCAARSGAVLADEATPTVATPMPGGTVTRSFVWTRVDLRVFVPLDASDAVHVVERLTVDFTGGPFTAGYREIPQQAAERFDVFQLDRIDGQEVRPLRYVAPEAFTREIPDTYTIEDSPGMLTVRWSFPPVTSRQQIFQIRYDTLGVLHERAGSREITWIAVGEDLSLAAPVENATLTIYLPRTIDAGQAVTNGTHGVVHSRDGRIWTWRAHDLSDGESLWGSLLFP